MVDIWETKEKSNWGVFKSYINSKSLNSLIYRSTFHNDISKGLSKSSFDMYSKILTKLFVFEKIELGCYKILQLIPKQMNTSMMFILLNKEQNWERWGSPIEDRVYRIVNNYKTKN